MSTAVTNYDFGETLHESPRTTVRRAVRRCDGLHVVIKALTSKYPSPRELLQVRREYRIARQIHAPGIVQVFGLETHGNGLAIVEEDFLGPPLSGQVSAIAGNLDDFFSIALGLVRVLTHVHEHVVHGDVSSSNLLWKRETGELRLIDFGSSSELVNGSQILAADELPDSSLPYVAPERSGRMGRVPDARSDLYSVGAILYELLTGSPAFSAGDRAEWHYCHATREPRPPSKTSGVPDVLSQIVLRLMAKNPEDRFQRALGLRVDLEECEKRWRSTGRVEGIAVGRRDAGGALRLPKQLYGRDAEMQALVSAFDAVARGATRVLMVSGEAGVGKSALVRELRRVATHVGGYFCEGKFDQFRRQAPYGALADALRQVVVQILCEPGKELDRWADALREAVAPNGRLVVELVPAFEHIVGPQPPVATANPAEAQNRFQATIATLVQALAAAEGPLVMFLDDLQWADVATLALLKRLLGDRSTAKLLFIGAYRDIEGSHPLGGLLGPMSGDGRLTSLHLSALDPSAVNQLVADALGFAPDRTIALSEVLCDKARGNPLVVRELLGTLHREGVIVFRSERSEWEWEIDRIARWGTSDDVVELLLQRLRALPIETQSWLKLAACLGASFSLRTLSVVGETSPTDTIEALQRAVQEGLIIPVDETGTLPRDPVEQGRGVGSADAVSRDVHYEFLHDRVQQAAYALVTHAEKSALHLRIGRLLLRHATPAEREQRLIEIAKHWSEGIDALESDAERLELAGLNHDAAKKAKRSVAYGPAFELAKAAAGALPRDAWKESFDRTYEIHYLIAECAYLVGEVERAEAICAELLRRARTPLEKGRVHAMQVVELTFLERMDDAVEAGLKGLRLLGVRLSAHPSTATILKELLLAKRALGGRPIAELEHARLLEDPAVRLAMRILIDFIPPAYLTGNDRLFAAAVLKQVRLSLKHGIGPEAGAAYASYVVLLAGLGDLESADEFGRLAMRLTDRFAATEMRCRNQVLYALFGQSWNRPWRELRPCFQEAVRAGLDSGDLLFAAYACGWIHLWDPDLDVRSALDEARTYLTIIEKTSYQNARDAALLSQQFLANLVGETESFLSLSDGRFDEEACRLRMTRGRNVSGLGIRALYRITLCVLYEEYERGFDVLMEAQPQMRALSGSPYVVEYCLHAFLLCASLPKSARETRAARKLMTRLRRMMGKWARHAPANFRAHELLIEAEWARLRGDVGKATRLYEQAVTAAREGRFARYEALANERAARFHASHGVDRVASMYMLEARYHYARWGATRKVRFLEDRYPGLFEEAAVGSAGSGRDSWRGRTSETPEPRLDVATVWKASQTISEEVVLDKLLARLVNIARQNAGATRVTLLLREPESNQLFVQAEAADGGPVRVMQQQPLAEADLPLSMIRYVLRSSEPVVMDDAPGAAEFRQDPYFARHQIRSMLAMPIVYRGEPLGAMVLENHLVSHAFRTERIATLQMLASQTAISLQNARLYEHVNRMAESFSRFVPREFLRNLGHSQFLDIRLGESVQKLMTVLFSDIRGFTTLVETMSPTENIDFVNTYISYMEPAILANGGFIDSYLGDGIMALFDGSPSDSVDAAIAMLRALSEFNADREERGLRPIAMGMGLNTGLLTLGTIGGAERLKCGVVGDTVNVASRIEGLTKRYSVPILISGETRKRVTTERQARTRFVDRVRVAGHAESTDIYELFEADPIPLRQLKQEATGAWQSAIDLYYARRFDEAAGAFAAYRDRLAGDAPASLFEQRARSFSVSPPGDDWAGVEVVREK